MNICTMYVTNLCEMLFIFMPKGKGKPFDFCFVT